MTHLLRTAEPLTLKLQSFIIAWKIAIARCSWAGALIRVICLINSSIEHHRTRDGIRLCLMVSYQSVLSTSSSCNMESNTGNVRRRIIFFMCPLLDDFRTLKKRLPDTSDKTLIIGHNHSTAQDVCSLALFRC